MRDDLCTHKGQRHCQFYFLPLYAIAFESDSSFAMNDIL